MAENPEPDKRTESGRGEEKEKTVSLEKLHEERRYWKERLKAETERHDAVKARMETALSEIKTASNNLVAMLVRTYGEKNFDGIYTAEIPVPKSGWLTAGKKEKRKDGKKVYVVEARKIE